MTQPTDIKIITEDETITFPAATKVELGRVEGGDAIVNVLQYGDLHRFFHVDIVEAITFEVGGEPVTAKLDGTHVSCPECYNFYKKVSSLRRHLLGSRTHDYSAKLESTCDHCGDSFAYYKRSENSPDRGKYCGADCQAEAKATSPKETVTCEACGTKFEARQHEERKFCSMDCVHTHQKATGGMGAVAD